MNYRSLGTTGLNISVLGLGTGTRFGDATNHSPRAATQLVRTALDLGVNYIDTAAIYLDAESLLGAALDGVPRDRYILATKFFPADTSGTPITPAELRASVERSLRRLRLDYVDILQIHGLRPRWHEPVMTALGDELDALHRKGRFRYLGVAETIVDDARHEMLPLAVPAGKFASALVAYSLLSPWAELSALPACQEHGVGVIGMVAVRRALRDPVLLRELIRAARERGEAGAAELPDANPLDRLLGGHCPTLAAAGYRFAIAHPAVACVLAGTLNIEHLKQNIAAVCAPPMANADLAWVRRVFLRMNPERWRPINL